MIGAQARASQRADGDSAPRRGGRLLVITVAAAAIALACYLTELSIHPLNAMLTWFDLGVYRQAGLIALHHPGELYQWHLAQGIRFTYTPFAAVLFAAVSWLPLAVLGWLMTAASLVALAVTGWLMAGALGWAGRARLIMTCAASAAGLWMEPVQRALHLGQIELLLMVAVVADRCMSDRRWWKGAAIGVAAGIKLVPLIFIPYLLLAGKVRQAVVASAAFAASIGAGFVFLPGQSAHFWLTGYFLRVQNVAGYGALVNQSVLGMLVRAHAGDLAAARPAWLPVAVALGAAGLVAAAVLHRSGRPVHGWLLCALTGLLVSPISWDHHWVWIVPILLVAADEALRRRGAARWACWAGAAAVALVFFAWPPWTGLHARGLLGFFPGPGMAGSVLYHAHGIQLLAFNLFVLTGLAIYALGLIMAVRVWRQTRRTRRTRRTRPDQDQRPRPQIQPGLPAGERAAAQ
ncbi:MAG TPA: sugar transporter superfamily protein [Actinobacteria bacterium]|jgi:alpha-1,2-mannosyltransferase|nr:sugar transporter superfamily protein [Actinomycetota bacterium]